MNANRKAFLDMLAVSEGTSTSRFTKCDGYDVIVIGTDGVHELITDFSTHPFTNGRPSKVFNAQGQTSSASGRYQFMKRDWAHYRDSLQLPDFGPESQDKWALQLIKERNALGMIDNGNFESAVFACKNIWASLPGAGYGQHENSMTKLRNAYIDAGGTFAGNSADVVAIAPTLNVEIISKHATSGFIQLVINLVTLFFRKKP